jgi:methylenetetrahydrofolate dehydrogenase (NADP+)/methenyltetrahydrofolate cyclohydrolase
MLSEVEHAIDTFNKSSKVTGFILQLPLDNKIKSESNRLINLINPIKDVDGLTSINLGKVSHLDKSGFIPATVEGILECINYTLKDRVDWFDNPKNNELSGKTIVIINNSNLIGKPLANILTNQNSSVSILNEYSKDIKTFTQNADIVISATGQGLLFDHTYFKDGVTLIDVTSKKVDNKIVGDFIISKELEEKASWVTPVPGGVGPLTVAFLMKNLVR